MEEEDGGEASRWGEPGGRPPAGAAATASRSTDDDGGERGAGGCARTDGRPRCRHLDTASTSGGGRPDPALGHIVAAADRQVCAVRGRDSRSHAVAAAQTAGRGACAGGAPHGGVPTDGAAPARQKEGHLARAPGGGPARRGAVARCALVRKRKKGGTAARRGPRHARHPRGAGGGGVGGVSRDAAGGCAGTSWMGDGERTATASGMAAMARCLRSCGGGNEETEPSGGGGGVACQSLLARLSAAGCLLRLPRGGRQRPPCAPDGAHPPRAWGQNRDAA